MIRPCLSVFAFLTVLTGLAYPSAITGISAAVFPWRAGGSLVEVDGKVVGSELLGQAWDDPRWFWSRPSGTSPAYNGGASSGTNYGPMNPALAEAAGARVQALGDGAGPVPIDLVTASGSGLDPHVSPEAALWQVPRVAKARGMPEGELRELVRQHVEDRTLGILGEPRVNVLRLNLALDGAKRVASDGG
jgi:K+-transporting ATPase ATPase C chain